MPDIKVAFWDLERHRRYQGYGGLYWGLRYGALACRAADIDAEIVTGTPVKNGQDFVIIGDQRQGQALSRRNCLLDYNYIVQVHGYFGDSGTYTDYTYEPGCSRISEPLHRFWSEAAAIVTVSKELNQDISRLIGRPTWRLWNCADTRMFDPRKGGDRRKELINIGALIKRKRPDRLNNLDFPVDLYGPDYREGYPKRLASHINYRGPIDHNLLPKILADYKILVHVAEREECPLVVIEALMMGLPIVAMDAGDIREMVGPAGIVVAQDDFKGMNEGIQNVLDNWKTFHRNALGRAERFWPGTVGKEWLTMFEYLKSAGAGASVLTEKQAILLGQVKMPSQREWKPQKPGLDVTVVIPCYNMAQFLPETIDSVLAQTFDNWEIVVVDDGSTDDLKSVKKKYGGNKHIKFIHQENQGLAEARNAGIAEAGGKWMLPLDADDILHPLALAKMVAMAQQHPDSVIYGDLWLKYQDGVKRWYLRDYDFQDLLKRDCMPPCSLFPKRAWVESGGYKHLGEGYEDWEFWITIGELGYHGVHIRQPVYWYRMKSESMWREALEAHDELHEKIVALHPNLYPDKVHRIPVPKRPRRNVVRLRYVNSDPPHSIDGPVTQRRYDLREGCIIEVAPEDAEGLLRIQYGRAKARRMIFERVE